MSDNEGKAIQVPEQEVISKDEMEGTRERQCFVPKTDIYETEQEIMVIADIPGASKESIEITLEKDILSMSAYANPIIHEGYKLAYSEYEPGDYQRSFRIATEIDHDKIEAKVINGELRLRLPKAEAAKARKIPVKTG